jgi:pimeloyl-ACP methyl ester carboxylesterase
MKRGVRAAVVVAALGAVLVVAAQLSGRQDPIDVVAETERCDGVDLESRLVETNGIRPGHDWGGAVAWYLVIEHPDRFSRLVMFNSAYPRTLTGDTTVRVPTRIVWGMQDRFFETRMAKLSVDHCADASLLELPDAGHWLLHEEPELTSNEMIAFFGPRP